MMRTWSGVIRSADREAYREYIELTGLPGYKSTPGNIDAWLVLRDRQDGLTEVVMVSLWESRGAIVQFAGRDIDRAVFYPEDDKYLVDRDLRVLHYDVVA